MVIHVHNVVDGEQLTFALPLLVGEVVLTSTPQKSSSFSSSSFSSSLSSSSSSSFSSSSGPIDGQVQVWNESCPTGKSLSWMLVNGNFKALVHLEPGKNLIHIRYNKSGGGGRGSRRGRRERGGERRVKSNGDVYDDDRDVVVNDDHHHHDVVDDVDDEMVLTLFYIDPRFTHFVRPVYIICTDDDGAFQGPPGENCSAESALRRIAFAAQLLQTFTAEKLLEHGFERRTFQIEKDPDTNKPICHLFRSKLHVEEASQMTGQQLWTYFAKELMMSPLFERKELCKWYCFMSFTRYNPQQGDIPKTYSQILKYTSGHTALGGGGLALFGSGNLHTWAEELQQLSFRFTDCRKIDRSQLMDDSAYREYYWANYSTGLGSSLHELGHTFDLAHTKTGVMARGFDDIHRVFTVQRYMYGLDRECKSTPQPHPTAPPPPLPSSSSSSSHHYSSSPRLVPLSEIDGAALESHARHYRDACYGSPFKRVIPPVLAGNNNNSNNNNNNNTDHSEVNTANSHYCSSNSSSSNGVSHLNHQQQQQQQPQQQQRFQRQHDHHDDHSDYHHQHHHHHHHNHQHENNNKSSRSTASNDQRPAPPPPPPPTSSAPPASSASSVPTSSSSATATLPLLMKVETDFRPVAAQTSLTMCVKNYDGTETHKTILQDERQQTVKEVTVSQDGKVIARKVSRTENRCGSTRNSRSCRVSSLSSSSSSSSSSSQQLSTAISTSSSSSNASSSSSNPAPASGGTLASSKPSTLPSSSDNHHHHHYYYYSANDCPATTTTTTTNTTTPFGVTFVDGGAHWYRSSAVLLRFHKWFNKPSCDDTGKPPVLVGSCIKCDAGLRLVELRTEPEGQVFCHWEFLQGDIPRVFPLQMSRLRNVPNFDANTVQVITVLAEDSYGNILKKKLKLADIED